MKKTGDLNLVKRMNKAIVLEYIQQHAPVSRATIASKTGLTKATVSTLVSEWIDSHMVYEIGTGESSGGRKPVMLLFHAKAGFVIGIDLGVNYIHALLTDLDGEAACEHNMTHANASVASVLEDVKACIRELLRQAPASPYGVVGIGIGIPGISDDHGNVLFAPNLGWENVPLQQEIEKEFGIPVVIENEANAGAVGEKRYGAGQDAAHLIYVSLGSGIGTGIIIKDELYRGATGFSGEIGHQSIDLNGPQCRCGNYGCWELYASEQALLESAKSSLGRSAADVDSLLQEAAQIGSAEISGLFAQLGRHLGIGLVNIVNSFNPELIIIGGRLTAAAEWLDEPIRQTMEQRLLPYPRKPLEVQFSALDSRSTVLGASTLAAGNFFGKLKS
ncbi:ROK family transcriptional regulator [Paenibacillus thalictri]|uniref:ROK family transcriptional regulator n=1 Tax=Paenibacillus thalictri TaxID=2527873 RepID=A0A4Q9DSR6_9BACL|nr:ROK family transcriptional regulator [Paenibacillus thalictri]TBL79937.1 ROK family transcriptional regulator [Paenibacillus thalictri]